MLRSMILSNFQSFDHIELDLRGKTGSTKNLAAIYGENGSGKSNLINALLLLKASTGIINGSGDESPESIFSHVSLVRQLAKDFHMIGSKENTKMQYEFCFNGLNFTYSMEYSSGGKLVSEKLDGKIKTAMGNLFTITSNETRFSPGFVKGKKFFDGIENDIERYWGNLSLISILIWEFRHSNPDYIEKNTNPNLRVFIEGLKGMFVSTTSSDICEKNLISLPRGEIDRDKEYLIDSYQETLSKFLSRLYSDIRSVFFKKENNGNKISYELFFRKNISGTIRDIPATWESTGTKKIIELMNPILSCVAGGIVFIDELDTGIHDLMITGLMEQTIPKIRGQLVFTTHNTCLMDSLSPDSVYIIGIDRNAYKKIRCVSSIERIRSTNSIRHKYYEGNFMGIPFLADLGLESLTGTDE